MSAPDAKSSGPADPLLPYGEPRIAVVVMLSLFGFGNFLFFPLTSGPGRGTIVPIAVWFGALLAEVGLVAMFGVLAPARTLARLGGAVTLAGVLTGALVLGLAMASL